MKNLKIFFFVLFFLFLNYPAFSEDANELLKRIDDKLMPPSYEAYRKLINIEPSGKKKEFIVYTVRRCFTFTCANG